MRYYLFFSRFWLIMWLLVRSIIFEFKALLGGSSGVGILVVMIVIFMFIVENNIFGLFPYIFTGTSHFLVTISFGFPIWVGLILFGLLNYLNYMFCHLVPYGTPDVLLIFIVVVERVRNLIRPITLTVRLGANMVAGHLLLRLLGGVSGFWMRGLSLFGLIILIILEIAVAIIQGYVFVTLLILYYREINCG